MAEKAERIEPPAQPAMVSVVVDRSEPRDYLGSWSEDLADEDLQNLKNSWVGTKGVLQAWREREADLANDKRFTEVGRQDLLARELVQFEARLKPYEQVAKGHAERAAEMEKNLISFVVPDIKEDSPVTAIRAGEVRQWFKSLPRAGAGGQLEVLQTALAEKDNELLGAVLSAPNAMKIIAPELRQHLIERMLENRDPEAVAELARRKKACDVANFALARVKDLLRGKMPLPPRERFIRTGTN